MIVEVIPESKSYKLDSFSYSVPEGLDSQVKVGSIVTVPFGKKKIRGAVAKIKDQISNIKNREEYSIKDIADVDAIFAIPHSYFSIIKWISGHYLASQGEALSLFLPPEMKRPPKPRTLESDGDQAMKVKKLSDAQYDIYSSIIKKGASLPHLLLGVTGSGKTEIYIHLCKKMLDEGKSVVALVPEIILTPQTIERFTEAFGNEVALVHSNLSQGEKYRAYDEFTRGIKKIVVGPRSALLIPNPNIGLIIVDEEHEDAYKQDQSPRYHAVDLAEQIAKKLGAFLVLGSATPRVESFYKAKSGIYQLHELKARYNKLLLPPAEIVDLRNELRAQNNSIISLKLQAAIQMILERKKQALLFLNRRGSSTFVSCRECGAVANCPNCDIPLIHHSANGSYLYCHHCDLRQEVPTTCPECGSVKIKFFGAGVEKVEYEIIKMFPAARVRRIDAETIKSKADYENFYHDFKHHKFDIAVGTQMITKGLDMPHVDLVGIISADTGLHMPFFRANEKVFRLVTQVSGRSGRADNPGQTIIQTYWPDSSSIKFAAQHDFNGFFNKEIENRKKHSYPPFCQLIRVVSEHEKPEKAKAEIDKLKLELDNLQNDYPGMIEYIGPGQCFFQRVRGRWRYHLIIKLHRNLINNEARMTNDEPNTRSQVPNIADSKDYHPELVCPVPTGGDSGSTTNNTDNIDCHSERSEESSHHELDNKLRELWKKYLNLVWDVDPNDLL